MAQWEKNPLVMQEMQADTGSFLQLGRSPGGMYGNPFQYSCLANAMDRESSIVHRFAELDTTGVVWHTCMHVVNV